MFKQYGFIGFVNLCISWLYTKLFFRSSRLIRLPFDIRNRKNISFGRNLTTGKGCRIEAYPNGDDVVLMFGENVQINDYVHITATIGVIIGNNVLIASKIYISDCNHGSYKGNINDSSPNSIPIIRKLFSEKVVINDNVWIGESVSILPGVTIGEGSIIGANSVVTNDIPPNVIAVGSPAKAIKKYNFELQNWEKINSNI